MTKDMKSRIKYLMFALAVSLVPVLQSCGTEDGPDTGGFPSNPSEPETPSDQKPCFIWIDAAANFPDFANSRQNIARDLAKAAEAGFTDIVVDVRPTTGDVLFKTDKCDQVEWLGAWTDNGYEKITRSATWDYLQAFIDQGHELGLRVYAAFNTFPGGNQTSLGGAGVVFRDPEMADLATMLNTDSGIRSIMDTDNSAKFFNPVHPDVQSYIISLLEDLAAYQDLDGIILDRGRFDGFQSDFSDYTREQFEAYIGKSLDNWPEDVLPAGWSSGVPSPEPAYFKQWLEFRAKTIHDFIESARTHVKAVNPDVDFGVYVGGWYGSYYDVGVNWASPTYDPSREYTWASENYMKYGYADHTDVMLIGAYASPGRVTGSTEWTMEGFCRLAKQKTAGGPRICAGGPDVGNWDADDEYTQDQENRAITESVKVCADACDGYFLFDMIHLKNADQWSFAKAGIDQLRSAQAE